MITKESVSDLYRSGKRQSEIAKMTGVSKGYVHVILRDEGLLAPPPSRMSEESRAEAVKLYGSGLSMREAAACLRVSLYDIKCALRGQTRSHGDSNHMAWVRKSKPITEKQRQLILGSLLGDASITKGKNKALYFQVSHCQDQLEYALHKASVLGVRKLYPYENHGFSGGVMHKLTFKNVGAMKEIGDVVLIGGKKRVQRRWLDAISMEGIAYWFMDDGTSVRRGSHVNVSFASYGFDEQENHELARFLTERGFLTRVNRCDEGHGFFLSMSRTAVARFMESVAPLVMDGKMAYKIKRPVSR